jgi:hypothetical protein
MGFLGLFDFEVGHTKIFDGQTGFSYNKFVASFGLIIMKACL